MLCSSKVVNKDSAYGEMKFFVSVQSAQNKYMKEDSPNTDGLPTPADCQWLTTQIKQPLCTVYRCWQHVISSARCSDTGTILPRSLIIGRTRWQRDD